MPGLLLFVAFQTVSLVAQEYKKETVEDSLQYKWEQFSVNLGMFFTIINSDISLAGSESGVGININLEDALGLSTNTFALRGDAAYTFGAKRRSHVRVEYFGLIRNSTKVLESEIAIGGEVYPIGTELSSRYDLHIIRGLYDYAYYQDERISLGLSAGLYVLPMNFSISTRSVIDESAKVIAPLPVFGMQNSFFITPKFQVKQNLDVLYVKTEGFQGSITDVNLHIEYNPFQHLGFGLGYNSFNYRFSVFKGSDNFKEFEGTIKTGFSGFLLYGKYYF